MPYTAADGGKAEEAGEPDAPEIVSGGVPLEKLAAAVRKIKKISKPIASEGDRRVG